MSLQNNLFEFAINKKGLIITFNFGKKYRYFFWNFKRNQAVFNFSKSF